jgi:predicted permease
MWAVPPSTVATTYCINTNKEATFASSCQLIATLIAVVFIPIYIILLTLFQSSNIFC